MAVCANTAFGISSANIRTIGDSIIVVIHSELSPYLLYKNLVQKEDDTTTAILVPTRVVARSLPGFCSIACTIMAFFSFASARILRRILFKDIIAISEPEKKPSDSIAINIIIIYTISIVKPAYYLNHW